MVDILGIATIEDVNFVLRSAFAGQIVPKRIKELMSVLVGAKYLESIGGFSHYRVRAGRVDLMPARDSLKGQETKIRLELAAFYPTCPPDFLAILESPHAP